ncbi:MAG: MauE/DoxX family redox-associated membrane protein [Pseudomonadota bacterium]
MVFVYALVLAYGALFISSLTHKARDFGAFRRSVIDYRLTHPSLASALSVILVAGEATCLLLLGLMPALGLSVAAGLLGFYGLAMAINILKGRRHIDCGCYAPGTKRSVIHWGMVIRNLAMAIAASGGAVFAQSAPAIAAWLDYVTLLAGGGGLIILYCVIETSLQGVQA